MGSEGRPAILVVDDEEATLKSARRLLRAKGHEEVLTATNGVDALELLGEHEIAVMVLDLIMPRMDGESVLVEVSKRKPDLPVIVITADYDVPTVVRCMKLGAMDYLLKPVDPSQLVAAVERAMEESALRYEASRLREQFFHEKLRRPEAFAGILTSDPAMLRVFGYIEAIARGSQPVLIVGETGAGKELIAKALHDVGERSGPFVAVNVAGLDDAMFSDTLFGHVPGAFTGADRARKGMIEQAAEGTLFLDEIGDLAEASQVKLLRLLQEREYHRLGSDETEPLRARVVAATHKDPNELRPDLAFRLRSYHLRVPPLRERRGDFPLLVEHFLGLAADDLGRPRPTVPPELYSYLANYDFPGNVRELQAMVFNAVARHERGVMSIEPFLEHMGATRESREEPDGELRLPTPMPSLREIERAAVAEALRRAEGNRSAAARMLGVSRPTIARHADRLDRPEGVHES